MLGNSFKWSESIKKESSPKETKQSHQIKNASSSSLNKNNQDIEVSIIIPSHNKYPLNLFTLYSLELQTFNPAKMEVILINDASTDQTEEQLKDYSPPYHFKYIHSKKKLGRAKGRNLGIRSARGSILIFLDAEMITEPDLVEKHYKYHQSKHNLILSGGLHSKVLYSCVFPEFSKKEVNRIAFLTEKNQEIFQRLQGYKDKLQEPYPLLDKGDLVRKTYKDIAYKEYPWFRQITRNFSANLEGFTLPWLAFLTRNVSIRKELIVDAGVFDEEFYHYGYEDWELGYRLYKMGAQYVVSDELATYHQEHPVGKNKWKETIANFGLFTVKHHEVDVLILGLELSGLTDLLTMNKILREYKLLEESKSEDFQIFRETFTLILETIILMLQVDIPLINILGAAGFGTNARKELLNEVNKLKDYPYLSNFLQQVIDS